MTSVAEAEAMIATRMPSRALARLPIAQSVNRTLAEHITAERDLPPFDRVTMDGIAIASQAFAGGRREFRIHAIQAAGVPAMRSPDETSCIRVMTGTPRPDGTDAVIPIERVQIDGDIARVSDAATVEPYRFIHKQGSDRRQGDVVLEPGVRLGPAEIAVLASAGRADVATTGRAKVAIVSTGDELVAVGVPEIAPHQIRSSNDLAIEASLKRADLADCTRALLPDDPDLIREAIGQLHADHDVLILSGGVSMGDFDFVPAVLEALEAEVVFHRIQQKPGKPMWFGVSKANKAIFALPGNPVSTLLCMTRYVIPALRRAEGRAEPAAEIAELTTDVEGPRDLTYFVPVLLSWSDDGREFAEPRPTNTSGDFSSLAATDGFIELVPGDSLKKKGSRGQVFRW